MRLNYFKEEERIMNKYSLSIKWKFSGEFELWNMIIISDDSKEYVTEVIKNYQKNKQCGV